MNTWVCILLGFAQSRKVKEKEGKWEEEWEREIVTERNLSELTVTEWMRI